MSDESGRAVSTELDKHFLPGVSFAYEGEQVPACELAWAMVASCGCVAGLHMMTEDVVTLSAAWSTMSGNAAMIKRDKARGFDIRMVKSREVDFAKCTHEPKYGYAPPPKPDGYSWATARGGRTLHLVPLTELDEEQQKKLHREWAEGDVRGKTQSVCERAEYYTFLWTRKWWELDGKPECTRCIKAAAQLASNV